MVTKAIPNIPDIKKGLLLEPCALLSEIEPIMGAKKAKNNENKAKNPK